MEVENADNSQSSNMFLYDVMKIELEEEGQCSSYQNNTADHSEFLMKFIEAEVARDPRTGLSICMLCLEDLQPQDVTTHMIQVHKFRRKFYKCWHCEEIFQDKTLYDIHKEGCEPPKFVKKKATVVELMKQAEEQYQPNICPICLIEVPEIEAHLEKEHVKAPVPVVHEPAECPICHKVFKHKSTLSQHKRYVHRAKKGGEECPECGKKFASPNLVTNHMRNVHPRDGKVHTCEECGKNYKSHQSLYQHLKHVHKQRRPFRMQTENTTDNSDS